MTGGVLAAVEDESLSLIHIFKLKEAMGLINDRFGRLEAQKSPERKSYPEMEIKGCLLYTSTTAFFCGR